LDPIVTPSLSCPLAKKKTSFFGKKAQAGQFRGFQAPLRPSFPPNSGRQKNTETKLALENRAGYINNKKVAWESIL
jgi:hypothetical protein